MTLAATAMANPTASPSPSASPTQRYTCPMHPEVVRAEPGQCPKCGMTLVPIKPDGKRSTSNAQHPTPNSEHGTHDANGMAVPQHEHQQHAEQEHEMHMSMQSSVNLADPISRES